MSSNADSRSSLLRLRYERHSQPSTWPKLKFAASGFELDPPPSDSFAEDWSDIIRRIKTQVSANLGQGVYQDPEIDPRTTAHMECWMSATSLAMRDPQDFTDYHPAIKDNIKSRMRSHDQAVEWFHDSSHRKILCENQTDVDQVELSQLYRTISSSVRGAEIVNLIEPMYNIDACEPNRSSSDDAKPALTTPSVVQSFTLWGLRQFTEVMRDHHDSLAQGARVMREVLRGSKTSAGPEGSEHCSSILRKASLMRATRRLVEEYLHKGIYR